MSAERKADILPLVRLTHQEVPQTSIPIEKEAPSWKCCFRVRLPDALVIHVATYQHVQAELSDHLAVATGHPDNFVVRYYSYESDVLAAKSDAQAVGSSVLELLGFSEVQIDTQLLVEPYMRSPDLHPI